MARHISAQVKTYLLGQLPQWHSKYPDIPQSVVDQAIEVVAKEMPCSLLRSLHEEPDRTPEGLNRLFARVGAILKLSSEELVRGADWNPKDLHPNRFDAMIAELRTVVFLSHEGFRDIRLLRSKGQKKADATALRGEVKYAVEITCVAGFKYPRHRKRSQNLMDFLVDRYHEKSCQMNTTAVAQGCQSRVLVFVFVEPGQIALATRNDYLENGLKPAWWQLGLPGNTHLAVIAHSSDNCVFPPWLTTGQ